MIWCEFLLIWYRWFDTFCLGVYLSVSFAGSLLLLIACSWYSSNGREEKSVFIFMFIAINVAVLHFFFLVLIAMQQSCIFPLTGVLGVFNLLLCVVIVEGF